MTRILHDEEEELLYDEAAGPEPAVRRQLRADDGTPIDEGYHLGVSLLDWEI